MANADKQMSLESLKNMQIMISNFCRVEDGSLMPDVNLRQYGFESGELVSNITVQELCTIHPHIRSLDLTYCKQVTDVGIWAIAKHQVEIEKLILYGCEKLTNVGIRSLALKLSNLTYLDLSMCYLVDDVSLTIIAGGSWKIKELYLHNCDRVTDNGICRLAQGLGKSLEILDLKGCSNVGEYGDRALREMGLNCHNIKTLLLTESKRVEDNAFIALSNGCNMLTNLAISGCDNVTTKGFRAILGGNCTTTTSNNNNNFNNNSNNNENTMNTKLSYNNTTTTTTATPHKNTSTTTTTLYCPLHRLKITGCNKITDHDFHYLQSSPLQYTLTTLELNYFKLLTDNGIAAICKTLGPILLHLNIAYNTNITDYSTNIIGNLCTKLRSLDLSYCGKITDTSVHTIAKTVSCLTSLKLDGNKYITTKAIISHIGIELEFVEMATIWLGYQPKKMVENLIKLKERNRYENINAIKIQSILRKKFATRIYYERYRSKLINIIIPIFQGHVRGVLERKKYSIVLYNIKKTKKAIIIQTKWRKYYALHERIKKMKYIKYIKLKNKLAILIQKVYRSYKYRKIAMLRRIEISNQLLLKTKEQGIHEINAIIIQRIYRGYQDRNYVNILINKRKNELALLALQNYSILLIQRIMIGKIGRLKAKHRRWEIAHAELRWNSARILQRIYRGYLGRIRYAHYLSIFIYNQKMAAATNIQRIYHGYRGRLLYAVAVALRILRTKQQYYSIEIQRFLRGCIGRMQYKIFKELETRRKRKIKAVCLIQRIFRGHKGREIREIEYQLQILDVTAKPLILQLKHLEESKLTLSKLIHRLETNEERLKNNLFQIEREYSQCQYTTSKYSDSSRINNTPQRFLTKFLIIRLKDLLEHETVRKCGFFRVFLY